MNEEEFQILIAEEKTKAQERRKLEDEDLVEWQRELRLKEAFDELNVTPTHFQRETGLYPEWDDFPFCPSPPHSYWVWYAKRVMRVYDRIVEDGWESDFEHLKTDNRNGMIAIGLIRHAKLRNIESLADALQTAIVRGDDGNEVKGWLAIQIIGRLRGLYQQDVKRMENLLDPHGNCDEEQLDDPLRQNGMTWQEAAERLLRLVSQGDNFTSQRQLGEVIGCSANTIGKAIRNENRLMLWAKEKMRKPKVFGASRQDNDNTAQSCEVDPGEMAEAQEELDKLLNQLIQVASDEDRAKYHQARSEVGENLEAIRLFINQLEDDKSRYVFDHT